MNQIAIENALPADLLHAIAAVIQAGPFESGKRMAQGLAQEAAKIICSWPLRPTRRCSTVFLQRSTPTRCSRRSPCHAHGVRHAVVGWLPSHIRDALQHEIIVKLSPVPGTLAKTCSARYWPHKPVSAFRDRVAGQLHSVRLAQQRRDA
ncbi:hypothetical protein B597_021715 [Stutzerimonas stutzeri KOS6]|uniref:Uncharacterized protein n=1 Tax=Stutzerimonas stutzeri KOS6 TaxID=1218352 RepID=A0A061JLS7_STUST|nr:hypothetical protein B597_021715 [Stutzerimonas stutzeri KOS6]